MTESDLLVGIDAGTSAIKAVAFDSGGNEIGAVSRKNRYTTRASDGAAYQCMNRTWLECAAALRELADLLPNFASRVAAVGLTAQGDGTWLVGEGDQPVTDGWIWLDSRAAQTAQRLRDTEGDATRFRHTGTGINACQQGSQLAHMQDSEPELLSVAEVALHPKDWLYLKLTGVRATDPSEACFTFGDFRTREYSDETISALGLDAHKRLLPPIVDGSEVAHPVTAAAASETGLPKGTPVSLGYVDVVCTAIGAGIYTGEPAACSILGSTGMHMRALRADSVELNAERTGYVMCLPVPGIVSTMQSNMAATLNIDWALEVAKDLLGEFGHDADRADLISRIEGWMVASSPGPLVYHPYISDAGERGPFVNPHASASLAGLNSSHRFPDMMRSIIEGLGLAARDCYESMGPMPREIRISGGAARSPSLRKVLAAAIGCPTRVTTREEAGAAGAAMIASVAAGLHSDMASCIDEWVTPHLGDLERNDEELSGFLAAKFKAYRATRKALEPAWDEIRQAR